MSEGNTPAARLLLVRHGQIHANVQRIWHGSTDSPLTDLGEQQAVRTAQHLAAERPQVAAVYASPLGRTRATAEPIARALGVQLEIEPGLAEFGIGELEGVSYAELLSEHRFFERIQSDPHYAPPGGESLAAVLARVSASVLRIAERHRGEEVIAVGHGAALGLALSHLIEGATDRWHRYQMSNASISELVLEPEPQLLAFDLTAHLS
jgi:broad specificity phosphatase PhoE